MQQKNTFYLLFVFCGPPITKSTEMRVITTLPVYGENPTADWAALPIPALLSASTK